VALVPGVAGIFEVIHIAGDGDLGRGVRENFLTNFGKSLLTPKLSIPGKLTIKAFLLPNI